MSRIRFAAALAAPAMGLFVPGCAPDDSAPPAAPGPAGQAASALSQGLVHEAEPNDDRASATALSPGGVALAMISPSGDEDVFAFEGHQGDRVFAATATAFSASSPDSILDLVGPDGATLESDNDNGSVPAGSSSIAGATLAIGGKHYLRVRQSGNWTGIRPYHLHLATRRGAPTSETEPNDLLPQALPPGGWVAGAISPPGDADVFTVTLNAGDTLFASLDLDPDRDGSGFDGTLGIGPFDNSFVTVDDPGGAGPDSEAFFATVKAAGTYGIQIASSNAASSGDYQLSVTVHPAAPRGLCTTYTSADGPITIPQAPGLTTSEITVPGNPRIADVDVALDITHDNPPDLDVSLVSPRGTQVALFTDIGSDDHPHLDLAIDDEAAFPAGTTPILQGLAVQPEPAYRLDWLDGEDAGGTWTLRVNDDAPVHGGTLAGWSLTVCEPEPPAACPFGGAATLLQADFEADDAGFTHAGAGDGWARGTPAQAPGFTDCHGGSQCFKTNLTGNYAPSSSQDLVSPPVDLTSTRAPITAEWAMKYQMENAQFDQAWVEVREVGGANPRRLWEWAGPTMNTDVAGTTIQEIAGWGVHRADLGAYAGKVVELVFHLQSDGLTQLPGLAIDDVTVTACPQAVCGNGSVEGDEDCDDGNTDGGDGCSATCTSESQPTGSGGGGAGGAGASATGTLGGGGSGTGAAGTGAAGTGGTGTIGDGGAGTGATGTLGDGGAGAGADGGRPVRELSGGGCGCRAAGDERDGAPWAPVIALLGLGLARGRRRRSPALR